jgi:hypothetical protein
MVRASRLIGKLPLPPDSVNAGELVRNVWPCAVGKIIAARTNATGMVRKRLIVEVEDAVWQRQLFTLTKQIVGNLEKHLGPGLVEDVEFRVVPSRRGPQRARTVDGLARDEADAIEDPVLRTIYRASRKKAQA